MDIGNRIKSYRINKGFSQKELASLIGVDISFICKVEKNEKSLTIEKLQLISNVLEINIDDLKIIFFSNKIDDLLKNETSDIKQKIFSKLTQTK